MSLTKTSSSTYFQYVVVESQTTWYMKQFLIVCNSQSFAHVLKRTTSFWQAHVIMRQIVNKIEQINKFWRILVTKLDIFLSNKLINIKDWLQGNM